MRKIWIFAEQDSGKTLPVYHELLSKIRALYPSDEITAVVLSADGDAGEALSASGADKVLMVCHEKLSAYHPTYFAEALYHLVDAHKPDILLVGATAVGSELAPTVAAKSGTGLAAHCADLVTDDNGDLIAIIPAFGGKLLGEILVPNRKPFMATVKPGVFQNAMAAPAKAVSVERADASFLDGIDSKIRLKSVKPAKASSKCIENADVVVCAGLGIGGKESFDQAAELASTLNGALGHTRPVVDMGYIDSEDAMIGTSGKLVHPKLYIGFGVSGATHHVCGMKDSKTIISINNDPDAEIFNVSDYKYIADAKKTIQELKTLLSQ